MGDEDVPAGPLRVGVCETCGLAQTTTSSPGAETPSLSSPSRAQRECFGQLAAAARARGLGGTIAVSGHHASTLSAALASAGVGEVVTAAPATLVVDHAGLAHRADLDAAVRLLVARLAPHGWIVIEAHHARSLLAREQFDIISHEHHTYVAVHALARVLAAHGIVVADVEELAIYDGSVRLWCTRAADGASGASVAAMVSAEVEDGVTTPARWRALGAVASASARAFAELVRGEHRAGRRVAGYGAPARAALLLSLAGVGSDIVEFTVDIAAAKHGRRIPGTDIPIEPVDRLVRERPDVVVVFPHDLVDEITTANAAVRTWGGRFLIPLPTARLVS